MLKIRSNLAFAHVRVSPWRPSVHGEFIRLKSEGSPSLSKQITAHLYFRFSTYWDKWKRGAGK